MKHLDLFSGIGGFSLAAQWVWGEEHNIHAFVEIDPFCQKILKKHWPEVSIISDIKEYKHDGTTIDLLTGGFPCQPFSCAGKRRGKEDDRYLWPTMLRVISEVRPTWIIGENVTGIINMELDQVLSDLESEGYETQPFIIPACGVDAPHRRNRVWILANSKCDNDEGLDERWCNRDVEKKSGNGRINLSGIIRDNSNKRCSQGNIEKKDVANTSSNISSFGVCNRNSSKSVEQDNNKKEWGENRKFVEMGTKINQRVSTSQTWVPEPGMDRMVDGIPSELDRLKSLGNAIVPQCVAPIMQTIKEINNVGR